MEDAAFMDAAQVAFSDAAWRTGRARRGGLGRGVEDAAALVVFLTGVEKRPVVSSSSGLQRITVDSPAAPRLTS